MNSLRPVAEHDHRPFIRAFEDGRPGIHAEGGLLLLGPMAFVALLGQNRTDALLKKTRSLAA